MNKLLRWFLPVLVLFFTASSVYSQTVIRFNRLGYEPRDQKMIVVASKDPGFRLVKYRLVNSLTGVPVNIKMDGSSRDFGRFGPFIHSFRVNISTAATPGKYKLIVNDTIHSEIIIIGHDVYHGTADATLAFLRDQRCGNETASLDSAHQTNDFIYGIGRGDSIQLNLAGGWHNVANEHQDLGVGSVITGYLLQAYREFPFVFNDNYDTWGKQGKNGRADVLDEGKWGLDWLLKMHPSKDRIYTALGNEHNPDNPPASNYNVAGRPVFLLKDSSGNEERIINTTSLLSTVLASGFTAFREDDPLYAKRLKERAENTYQWSARYAWKLGSKNDAYSGLAMASAAMSSISPDKKYQVSNGNYKNKSGYTDSIIAGEHFVIADDPGGCANKKSLLLKWKKIASSNAFHFSGGFNANSNYRLVLMFVEAMHYRQACGDTSFMELEQSCLDWLLGNNPWGVVMLAGLPVDGTISKAYPPASFHSVRRGLVNGPIADSIYKSSDGNSLLEKDNLENWQSSMAVYHDDAADYTTNEPQTEGTAAMVYLLASRENASLGHAPNGLLVQDGAILRGDSSRKKIALVFIGMTPAKGAKAINQILAREKIRSSFFLPIEFLKQKPVIAKQLKAGRHYIGAAGSEEWWNEPGSLKVQQGEFGNIMMENRRLLKSLGANPSIRLSADKALNYLYNCDGEGKTYLVNPTPGTLSRAANLLPGNENYAGSDKIFQDIMAKARQKPYGLNGYFLVFPTDAPDQRPDKFYMLLPLLLQDLKNEGYSFVGVDEMLGLAIPKAAPAKKKAVVHKKKKRRR